MSLLSVKNLSTEIRLPEHRIEVVKNVSFEVERGETVALVGESGSGKSITALSIVRLLPDAARVTSGSADLQGTNLLRISEKEMRAVRGGKVAMIFQEPMTSLNPVMKAGDQIIECLRQHQDLSKKAAFDRSLELLDAVGLPNPRRNMQDYPHQLSGGMRQRIMIAIALAADPDLLIADEPTTALDVTIQAQVLELLAKLQEEFAMGLLFITHDLGVVQQIADKVLVMRHGELVETAASQSFFSNPQHEYSKQLLGAVPSFEKRGARLTSTNEHIEPSTSGQPKSRIEKADSAPLLRIDRLKVYFPIRAGLLKRTVDHVRAVDDVSLQLEAGQTLALVGESGSGKTTVGKAILRLVEASSGEVHFDGCDVLGLSAAEMSERRKALQIVFQDPFSSMNPRMRIGDIIEEGMRALNVLTDGEQRRKRIVQLLDQVGLPANVMSRYPHEFSGGQRQRVCIARALAVDPKVIICDEPTSALDVSVQAQVLNLLNDLQDELGVSYLFITHNMSVVAYLADTVAVMRNGKIVEQGVVDEVLYKPQQEYTQQLLKAVPQLVL